MTRRSHACPLQVQETFLNLKCRYHTVPLFSVMLGIQN
uniref:Uncharacterized protein n=1 Tax=Nelumbo nucifera TaxID=4432 RepID=A0A822YUC5_NELNU|nr:TPA_asm: hypothetical protein HUJ06_008345 [Nelumbo nucifera]